MLKNETQRPVKLQSIGAACWPLGSAVLVGIQPSKQSHVLGSLVPASRVRAGRDCQGDFTVLA